MAKSTLQILLVGLPQSRCELLRHELQRCGFAADCVSVQVLHLLPAKLKSRRRWDAIIYAPAVAADVETILSMTHTHAPDVPVLIASSWEGSFESLMRRGWARAYVPRLEDVPAALRSVCTSSRGRQAMERPAMPPHRPGAH